MKTEVFLFPKFIIVSALIAVVIAAPYEKPDAYAAPATDSVSFNHTFLSVRLIIGLE